MMDVEDPDTNSAGKKQIPSENNNENEENKNAETLHEKIMAISSPLKTKKKLQDSPFRLFDHLDARKYYNHPKLSYAFILITAQLIDLIEFDDLVNYAQSIVDNLIASSNCESGIRAYSQQKRNKMCPSVYSSGKGGKIELFNDVLFLQSM